MRAKAPPFRRCLVVRVDVPGWKDCNSELFEEMCFEFLVGPISRPV